MFKTTKRIVAAMLAVLMLASFSVAFATDMLPSFTLAAVTDGGGYIVRLKEAYQPGELVTVRAVPNDGFVFYAWKSDDVVFSNQASDTTTFIMPAKEVTIGAIFAVKQTGQESLSVTFDTMGGSEFGTQYVNVGEALPKPENVPVKEGYTFGGWYTDTTCTLPFDFATPIYNATILYAKWNAEVSEPVNVNKFTDVSEKDWFYSCVTALAERNIISGMGNSVFAPQNNISRAQFATILANLANADFTEVNTPFADVAADAWYAKAVSWAYSNGIVNGKSATEFVPNANVSRQEMAVMIKRYVTNVAKVTLVESNAQADFADDASIAAYAKEAVYAMQRAGIIGGKPGNVFDPVANATRAEASKMIYVLLGLLEL
ncbi:MAG: S-layer homology domain-containing protein [Oscillospiraceae bacterium]|nr:S-layer homology domain-containing protein [Oscillospiraceae bacterium]